MGSRLNIFFGVLMAGIATFALASSQRSVSSEVSILFALRASRVSLHEPVFVHFTVHNYSPSPINLDLGPNAMSNFEFTIVDPQGANHHMGPLKPPPFSGRGTIHIKSGGSFERDLLVNRWYQFPIPGKYEIEPRLTSSIANKTINAARVMLTLDLEPRSPKQLRRVCAHLAAAAMSPELGAAIEPAETLAYVDDLIAVPFLGEIAEHGEPFRTIALQGLARIANTEGLGAVSKQLKPQDTHLRTAIAQALYDIQHRVSAVD